MTGSGGWPLTVFLLPTGEPFFGGTYFPPEDRYGRAGFPRVLEAISDAYRNKHDDVVQNAQYLVKQLNRDTQTRASESIGTGELDRACQALASRFDSREGGFGGAPKFPPSMSIDFLLRYHHRTGNDQALQMVTLTLDKMACGGMYDQVGGGFHRYSTDDHWLAPHFEKMLYDNALLARAYLDAYRSTREKPLLQAGLPEETLDFINPVKMRDPNGQFLFHSRYPMARCGGREFMSGPSTSSKPLVGERRSADLAKYFDNHTLQETSRHHNILNVPNPDVELEAKIQRAKRLLFDAREKRIRPGRDEKILTDWNGLMLRAFAEAALYLNGDDYRAIAIAEMPSSRENDVETSGRLLHNFKDGRARFNGYLDDYASFADGLLALYELAFRSPLART